MPPRKKAPPNQPEPEVVASVAPVDVPVPTPVKRRRRGSPPNKIYWWEAVGVILKRWSTRIGLIAGAIGQTAYEFCSENKTALMAAAPFWLAALVLIALGAVFSRPEIAEKKQSDNTGTGAT